MSSKQTFTYFTTQQGHEVQLDLYLPPGQMGPVSAMIFFHGGALVTGGKSDALFPIALKDDFNNEGVAFISANYRLLNPSTGFDIIEDMHALWSFISTTLSSSIDINNVAVGGASAGAYVARLAALNLVPKPKAVLSAYGMGGQFLSDHFLTVGSKPSGRLTAEQVEKGPHLWTPRDVTGLLSQNLPEFSDSPLSMGPSGANDPLGRAGLASHYWHSGTFLDILTDSSTLSSTLRGLSTTAEREAAVPAQYRALFPQLLLDSSFPPTVLVHGKKDSVILQEESDYTLEQLQKVGVRSQLYLEDEADHGMMLVSDKPGPPQPIPTWRGVSVAFVMEQLRA